MLPGRGDIKVKFMFLECFEVLRMVTSIIYTSLLQEGMFIQNRTIKVLGETRHYYLQLERHKQNIWNISSQIYDEFR